MSPWRALHGASTLCYPWGCNEENTKLSKQTQLSPVPMAFSVGWWRQTPSDHSGQWVSRPRAQVHGGKAAHGSGSLSGGAGQSHSYVGICRTNGVGSRGRESSEQDNSMCQVPVARGCEHKVDERPARLHEGSGDHDRDDA